MDIIGDDVDDLLDELSGEQVSAGQLPVGFAGLTPTTVATLSSANIKAPLNAYLRPDRLVMGSAACVATSRVTDIKVGTISLNVGEDAVPCECFAKDAIGTRLKAAVTGSPSVPPIVSVYNGTGGSIVYEGGFFGPAKRA